MTKAIVSLSGGMDSTTVLAVALDQGRDVSAIGFFYNSKHNVYENQAAIKIVAYYDVPFKLIDLSQAMKGFTSNLMSEGGDIPEGHYEAENMRLTVVPNRNMIFASILAGIAVSEGAEEIWLGTHMGDHYIYADCRPAFIASLEQTIRLATDTSISLISPFSNDKKVGILQKGFSLAKPVPYHLTRTCYKAQSKACGKCGSCQERKESFTLLGKVDPIEYE